MQIAFFSTKDYDRRFFDQANKEAGHDIHYYEARLRPDTADLAKDHRAVCAFVQDDLCAETLERLRKQGVELVALRCAGFNNVDLDKAADLGLTVVRVPAYSPDAVAEHTVGLMLALNRKIHRAHNRIIEHNFSLKGLMGFDMKGKTAGVIGAGNIGRAVMDILLGFGCKVICHAHHVRDEYAEKGVEFVGMDELFSRSDIVTLHVPLTPETRHMIDGKAISRMREGVMIVNTSRGKVVDTEAVIEALKSGKVGYFGMDVYEEEGDIFYRDLSEQVIEDDVLARMMTMPNVLITGHQGYFTREALTAIAETTLSNVTAYMHGEESGNEVTAEKHTE
jgi:D-lactate dehydrogenase